MAEEHEHEDGEATAEPQRTESLPAATVPVAPATNVPAHVSQLSRGTKAAAAAILVVVAGASFLIGKSAGPGHPFGRGGASWEQGAMPGHPGGGHPGGGYPGGPGGGYGGGYPGGYPQMPPAGPPQGGAENGFPQVPVPPPVEEGEQAIPPQWEEQVPATEGGA